MPCRPDLGMLCAWMHVPTIVKVPWAQFPSKLPKNGAGGLGWREWRLNMYRYVSRELLLSARSLCCSLLTPPSCCPVSLICGS